ncbi:UNVERIFIED_CONTAM: hypothetical protein Sradi_4044600 [Sesamum radiatum]|uniref:DUF676 domain-containing protein n=1 Tax=Sesamum radiatum TaxID=300843 RepID=A0AAW2PLI7_SESRA
MLEAIHEIAIYIHRFHNLDLFQQGWYQIKITMRWTGEDSGSLGTPARVAQYEAPDLGSDDVYGVWRIDDRDHSFSTQPFRIRYARQDILLSLMVSFTLQGPCTSAVILKFELLYTPVLENRSNIQDCLDNIAAVHEFRLPPKALLGLHAYCPVHFDAFHAVLVDITVHVSLLRNAVYTSSQKVPSGLTANGYDVVRKHDKSKQVLLVQALLSACEILTEELKKLSQAINEPIDIREITPNELFGLTPSSRLEIADAEVSGQVSSKLHGASEKAIGEVDFHNDAVLRRLSEDKLLKSIDLMGHQVLHLWSIFLNFHRANTKKILEFLRNQWAVNRKAEWSIWMVHTKVDMPHQYISSLVDASAYHGLHGRLAVPRKLTDDPAQAAAMRAELHRRSIAQMMIPDCNILAWIWGIKILPALRCKSCNCAPWDLQTDCGVVVMGHHLDLRLIRNQWLLLDPKTEFLMSEANEEKTSGDFRDMGRRLAQEVVSFVKKKMDKVSRSGVLKAIKLSFVGHSIGNIILRTALTESIMEPYLRYLHTYLSVSGPHLGYLYSSNSLFNGGLWVLKKLKNTQCIHQLTFTDDPDLRNTFLYKLAKQKTLENFRNVILLSSPQDGYVPYHSARLEMCPASSGDHSKKGKVFLEMLNECLDQIRARSVEHRVFMRCDVNFDVTLQGKNLNTIIGRAAHIEFLETDVFASFIMWSFPDLFR